MTVLIITEDKEAVIGEDDHVYVIGVTEEVAIMVDELPKQIDGDDCDKTTAGPGSTVTIGTTTNEFVQPPFIPTRVY